MSRIKPLRDTTTSPMKSVYKQEETTMAQDKFKVIWLNEMGEEQVSYHETEEDRNAKLQALADDGYSPVWREV